MKKYEKYKDSGIPWLGMIPEHWETKRLGVLFHDNISANSDFAYKHAYRFNYGGVVPKNEIGDVNEYKDTYTKYSVVHKNDIILNGLNLNYDFISQRVAIVPDDGIITSAYIVARPRPSTNADYYVHLLKTMDNKKMFHGMGTGIRLTLSFNELRKQMLPSPPPSEQEKIAHFIETKTSNIDAYVAERERELRLLDELKQAQIAEAVTHGLNPNVRMKDSGIPWIGLIPEHWEVEPFGRHFTFGKGLPITKADLISEGIAVISYGQIHAKNNTGTTISEDLLRRVSADYLQTNPQSLLKTNDFVFADTSEDVEGSGNFAFNDYPDKIFAGYHTIIARPKELLFPKYYAFLLQSVRWKSQIRSAVNGVKVYSINKKILKNTRILIPPQDEQKAIVDFIDKKCNNINSLISELEAEIAYLKEYKQRLVADAVTGQIKVF